VRHETSKRERENVHIIFLIHSSDLRVIVGKEVRRGTGVGHTSGSKLQEKEEKKSRKAGCCAGYKPVYEEEIESGRERD
jgi:hypothetical protein